MSTDWPSVALRGYPSLMEILPAVASSFGRGSDPLPTHAIGDAWHGAIYRIGSHL
ncbi:MAG: hypothetical protein AAGI46_12510 [Planctomycetota bacterium]